ncbi:hypothetical protein ACIQ1J_09775 [Streptomyces sp. NPDC097107]|uniref:hypothetical protein n=1 Tax=Streptomyces sp. NPDC097107 TaxID=3366089 RepID=UPI0038064D1E
MIPVWVRLRRAGTPRPVLTHVVLPVLGAAADLYLLTRLDHTAVLLGSAWLVLIIACLGVLTRDFRREPPGLRLEAREQAASTAAPQ